MLDRKNNIGQRDRRETVNIVFMGTPDFAAVSLKKLIDKGHHVELVVTQPDRRKNRGKKIISSPVKDVAIANGIPVIQPVKLRNDDDAKERLRKAHEVADIGIVVAYGQILPNEVLEMPSKGYINVHASLLPKLRGASPIQTAILCGEDPTGVSIMKVEEELDSGAVYSKSEVDIDGRTAGELESHLAEIGAKLLVKTLSEFDDIIPKAQNDSDATFCGIIKKEDGLIDFSKSAKEIERMCRAYDPWPGTFAKIDDKTYKFWKFDLCDLNEHTKESQNELNSSSADSAMPGEIIEVDSGSFVIACGSDGCERIRVLEIQAPGKRRMRTDEFLRGNKLVKGMRFNEEA